MDLEERGQPFGYEDIKITYVVPEQTKAYLPDYRLDNGILIEAKGWFKSADRTKMKRIKDTHPDLDVRLLFARAGNKLNKQSKTTYGDWCDRYGFKWAEGTIPDEWIDEPACPRRAEALENARKK